MYVVPTMMARISKLPDDVRDRYDVSSLKVVWHLGAPCPPWLKETWIDWLGPDAIWELYAGTEAQAATLISGADWLAHRGSVGRPLVGRDEGRARRRHRRRPGRDRRDLHAPERPEREDVQLRRRRGEAHRRRLGVARRHGRDRRRRLRVPRRPPDRHDPRRRLQRVPGRGRGRARRAPARAVVGGDRSARRRPRQPHPRDRADRRRHADRRRRAARASRPSGSCATRSRATSSSRPSRCATTRARSAARRCGPSASAARYHRR